MHANWPQSPRTGCLGITARRWSGLAQEQSNMAARNSVRRKNRVKSHRARFPPTPSLGNSPALTGKIFLATVRTVLRRVTLILGVGT
jgi:hypothetical protein